MGGGNVISVFLSIPFKSFADVRAWVPKSLICLFLALMASVADASQSSSFAGHQQEPNLASRLYFKPSFNAIEDALNASGRPWLYAVAILTYDAMGNVKTVRLEGSTGVEAVDEAILDWCRAARLTRGAAGEGRLPFNLSAEEFQKHLRDTTPEITEAPFSGFTEPLDTGVIEEHMRQHCIDRLQAEVKVLVLEDGAITDVTFLRSTRDRQLDRAIIALVRAARVKTSGQTSYARVPFDLVWVGSRASKRSAHECDIVSRRR